ncbi:MAG: isoprenyl transferase [Bacteroidota bacterium]
MQDLKAQLDLTQLPGHVAIIMDGNGRWAKERGEDRLFGHFNGVQSVRDIVEASAELGIRYLTLYAFSTENWDRPQAEVSGLMELLVNTIRKEVDQLKKNGIRLHVIGDLSMLPPAAQQELTEALELTAENDHLHLIMALSYSGRWDLAQAFRQLAQKVQQGVIPAEAIDADAISDHLATRNFPDPELMIRTSGEHRISNFLLYQLAYAELYFTETLWPDFRRQHLFEALLDYQQRERRFGKTSEQIAP